MLLGLPIFVNWYNTSLYFIFGLNVDIVVCWNEREICEYYVLNKGVSSYDPSHYNDIFWLYQLEVSINYGVFV